MPEPEVHNWTERLVRIETMLEIVVQAHADKLMKLEERVASLEKFRWALMGAAAAGGGLAGTIAERLFG